VTITVDAVYENGVLKLSGPVPLQEHQKVRVTIQSQTNWVEETSGIIGWKGSADLAERFAKDPELDFPQGEP
jgi:predicted DNA-binding antitoxin AbrB/MazE fold protein